MNEQQKPAHDQTAANLDSLFKKSKPLDAVDPMASARNAEAYNLMLYASDDGSVIETLWNSRDGVTPFIVGSRVSSTVKPGVTLHTSPSPVTMKHVLWGGDARAPFHIPNIGDRIFVDITAARSEELAREFIAKFWDGSPADGIPPMSESFKTRQAGIDSIAQSSCAPGTPDIVEVTAEMQATFFEARKENDAKIAAALGATREKSFLGASYKRNDPSRFA